MKKILIPVDFSDCSNAAVEVGLSLAAKANATVYFLHLFPDHEKKMHVPLHEDTVSTKKPQNIRLGRAKEGLSALVAKARNMNLNATPVLVHNEGYDRIEDYLQPYGIDLVVMGSHGERGIKEMVLGSHTHDLIKNSPVPVLVIKHPVKDFAIHKIAFASSFSEDSIRSFDVVRELAGLWNAEICLLYVNTPYHFKETHESLAAMKRFMHQFPGVNYTPVVYDALNEERGIDRFAKDNNMDIIAISTHGRKGFWQLIVHSVAETVITDEEKPVLVINLEKVSYKAKPVEREVQTAVPD